MVGYKKRIFVRAIQIRMETEQITAEQALEDYPKLTTEDKQEILAVLAEVQYE